MVKLTVGKGKSVTVKGAEVAEEAALKVQAHRAVKFESSLQEARRLCVNDSDLMRRNQGAKCAES